MFLIIIGVILYSIFFYLLNKTSYINGVYNSFLNHNYTINTNKPGGIFILLLSFIINVYPMVSLISIIIYFNILKKIPSRKITDKGKMSLIKINGLKNFLEDFSNIDDSKLEELHLRDFYLPYSVILNINNKASKELIDKINNIIHID